MELNLGIGREIRAHRGAYAKDWTSEGCSGLGTGLGKIKAPWGRSQTSMPDCFPNAYLFNA